MYIYTDDSRYASKLFDEEPDWKRIYQSSLDDDIIGLSRRILSNDTIYMAKIRTDNIWKHLFIVEYAHESHFDVLKEYARKEGELPNGTICFAGTGKNFHGFRNREWISVPGNVHLAAYMSPMERIENFGPGFTILAASAALKSIREFDLPKELTGIKWVNDIFIDGAKTCGVLAYTQSQDKKVTDAVIGIGMNVEKAPDIKTDRFVPKTTCLKEHLPQGGSCNMKNLFQSLLHTIDSEYKILTAGKYDELHKYYSNNLIGEGREVAVWSDEPDKEPDILVKGKLLGLNENLGLLIDGADEPITHGRLEIL